MTRDGTVEYLEDMPTDFLPNFIEPSAEELAEIAAELDELRRAAWGEWLATEPVIDLDDEF